MCVILHVFADLCLYPLLTDAVVVAGWCILYVKLDLKFLLMVRSATRAMLVVA